MAEQKTLRDIAKFSSNEEVQEHLFSMSKKFYTVAEWITINRTKSDCSMVLVNFLRATARYISILSRSIDEDISVIALAARSTYEVNIQLRTSLRSDDDLKRWMSEALTDRADLLKATLTIQTAEENSEARISLQNEIDRLAALRHKYNLPEVKKPAQISKIAEAAEQKAEHDAFFKLYSKLVHPSSYLINAYQDAASVMHRQTLQLHAQLYAWDSYERICEIMTVSQEVRAFQFR